MAIATIVIISGIISAALAACAFLLLKRQLGGSSSSGPRCGHCSYDLTGSESNRCTECGKMFIEAGVLIGQPEAERKTRVAVVGSVAIALFSILLMFGLIHFAVAAARSARQAAAAQANAAATNAFLQQTLAAASQPTARTKTPD